MYVKNYNEADDISILDYLDTAFESFNNDDMNVFWNKKSSKVVVIIVYRILSMKNKNVSIPQTLGWRER